MRSTHGQAAAPEQAGGAKRRVTQHARTMTQLAERPQPRAGACAAGVRRAALEAKGGLEAALGRRAGGWLGRDWADDGESSWARGCFGLRAPTNACGPTRQPGPNSAPASTTAEACTWRGSQDLLPEQNGQCLGASCMQVKGAVLPGRTHGGGGGARCAAARRSSMTAQCPPRVTQCAVGTVGVDCATACKVALSQPVLPPSIPAWRRQMAPGKRMPPSEVVAPSLPFMRSADEHRLRACGGEDAL